MAQHELGTEKSAQREHQDCRAWMGSHSGLWWLHFRLLTSDRKGDCLDAVGCGPDGG